MVSIGRLPSGRWQARTRIAGRQVKRSFDRRRQAEDWLAETRVDTARGIHLDEKAGRQLVGDYVRTWLKGRPHRASTAERQRSLLRNHVIETHLGRMRLVDVKPSDVQTWATGRSRVLAPSTLRVLRSLVGAIFSSAVLDRAIAVSPVTRVTLPRHDKPRVVPLRVDQVRALEAALPPRYRALVVAQAGLGLRISELLGLRPEDVDWLGRVRAARTGRVVPAAQDGVQRAGRPDADVRRRGAVPACHRVPARPDAVHGREGWSCPPRLVRHSRVPEGREGGRVARGDDTPRPATPLRERANRCGCIGGGRGATAGPRERGHGHPRVRAPRRRPGRPHPAGTRRSVVCP